LTVRVVHQYLSTALGRHIQARVHPAQAFQATHGRVDAAYETLLRHPRYTSAVFEHAKMISSALESAERGFQAKVTRAP
jgi:hypothetical protein